MTSKVLLKRKHNDSSGCQIICSPQPPTKKKVVCWTANNVSDDETCLSSSSDAAATLLQLSRTTMPNWAQYFDEPSSSSSGSDDEEQKTSSRLREDQMIKSLVKATFDAAAAAAAESKNASIEAASVVKPDTYIQSFISKQTDRKIEYHKASDLQSFFDPITTSKTDAYTLEICKAVRSDDVATLRRMHAQGNSMEACNKYGDSIVHLACRRNSERVLSFLLQTCQVPCKLVCDYGRTPLHDACWTTSPNYTIIGMLLDVCPDLLYVKDARGSTAFEYLKKEFWPEMCAFLQDRSITTLLPKEL